MKFFIKFFIVFIFLSAFNLASAAALSCTVAVGSCPNPSDVIMLRMSGNSNAHAGLPASSPYTTLICCSGPAGLANSCSGNYKVFDKLSGATNAHSRTADLADYPGSNNACISAPASSTISIGYQDSNCAGFDTTILSMTASTNAHVGEGSIYVHKICATVTTATSGSGSGGGFFGGFFGSSGGSPAAASDTPVPGSNQQSTSTNAGITLSGSIDSVQSAPQASGNNAVSSSGSDLSAPISAEAGDPLANGSDNSNQVLGNNLAAASIFGINFTPGMITWAIFGLAVLSLALIGRKIYFAKKA